MPGAFSLCASGPLLRRPLAPFYAAIDSCFYSHLPYDPEFEIPFVSWQDLQAELPERLGCARRKQIRDLEAKMAAILGDGHSAESVSRLLHRNCGWLIKEMRERVRKAYAESPYSNF